MDKPQYLYRGIKLDYDLLHQVKLYGVDMKPHYDPIIDSQGRKTVTDGNEYGVYMTDNLTMVQNAYAHVDIEDGKTLRRELGRLYPPLKIPAVGVIYQIDTEGTDAHKPWITDYLQGHYNNGFEGSEWVAEKIPADKYTVISATIGPDWLHDAQKLEISDISKAEDTIKRIVEVRKHRLELLEKELEKLSPFKRTQLTRDDVQLYKDLFGKDGVHYVDINAFQPKTGKDWAKYLLSIFYHGTRDDDLDYPSLKYIETLKSRLTDTDGLDRLTDIIKDDIATNTEKRQAFARKKREAGEPFNTMAFDDKEERYNNMLYVLKDKVKTKEKTSLVTDRGRDGFVVSVDKLIAKAFAFVAKQVGKQHDLQRQQSVGKQRDDFGLS